MLDVFRESLAESENALSFAELALVCEILNI